MRFNKILILSLSMFLVMACGKESPQAEPQAEPQMEPQVELQAPQVNRAPVVERVARMALVEYQTVRVDFPMSDPDGDALSIEIVENNQGVNLKQAASGVWYVTASGQAGIFRVLYRATDGELASDIASFDFIVVSRPSIPNPPNLGSVDVAGTYKLTNLSLSRAIYPSVTCEDSTLTISVNSASRTLTIGAHEYRCDGAVILVPQRVYQISGTDLYQNGKPVGIMGTDGSQRGMLIPTVMRIHTDSSSLFRIWIPNHGTIEGGSRLQ